MMFFSHQIIWFNCSNSDEIAESRVACFFAIDGLFPNRRRGIKDETFRRFPLDSAKQRPEKPIEAPLVVRRGEGGARGNTDRDQRRLCDIVITLAIEQKRVCAERKSRIVGVGRRWGGAKLRSRFSRLVPGTVEIHHGSSVMPRNAAGRYTLHINGAREAYRATLLHVDVFRPLDFRLCSCNTHRRDRTLKYSAFVSARAN